MYEGKQVVRFVNNYKGKDLYNIGNEMDKRKGTGNYDDERTKFNIHYKDIKEKSLYQEVKNILNSRNIEYLHKTKTNMLNGVTFTSGPEFFQTLGLPFKKSGRTYQSGDKEGQDILVPDIKSKNDIREEVINYFDSCMEYLKSLVGEENIVMAHVHFDEDTPHLQAYFLPVVNEVNRKCFKRDSNGELIKEKVIGSNGKEKEVPILLRDNNNNIIYEIVKGNFLNNDQFWKDLGGKSSFATIQDSFNKFINDKGYKLDRGKVGSSKKHQTKLEHQIDELKNEISNLWKDIDSYNDKLKKSKEILENSSKEELNIKKNLVGYSAKEVEKLIDYSNNLKRINDINKYELESKDSKIFSLTHENEFYKNNKELMNIRKYSHEKDNELRDKKTEVDYLNKALNTITRALDIKLNRKPMLYINDYVKLSISLLMLIEILIMRWIKQVKIFTNYLNKKNRKDVINIAIRQAKKDEITKDGRSWYVDLSYTDLLGRRHRYHSKKFDSRRDARDHEAEFKLKVKNTTDYSDMTFKDLIDEHYNYQQDKVKVTTLKNYRTMRPFLEPLDNLKLVGFNIRHYEMWRQTINARNISTRYKNGLYKYLKTLLNFGTKWYDINFFKVYSKMTNFNNPNERKKEMLFYTHQEFQKFLSVEYDLKYRCAFQTLFYCGLRNGELRGLAWEDIDFNKRILTVNKNVVKVPNEKTNKNYTLTSPKTSSSYRTIPIPLFLINDLEKLYDKCATYYGFKDKWFVFGDVDPIADTTFRNRKTMNAFNAGVKDIRIHDFRHSCASLLIDSGANITLVAKYLGHTKIDETLNTYSHMYQNRLDTIVNIIENQNEKFIDYKPKEQLPEPKKIFESKEDQDEYIYIVPKKKKLKEKDDLVL